MAKEVLTKLSNDDLAQVCGGQIYAATEGNVTKYFVPTPPNDKYRARFFETEQLALEYASKNGLFMHTVICQDYQEAINGATAKRKSYHSQNAVPSDLYPNDWQCQYIEFLFGVTISPLSY